MATMIGIDWPINSVGVLPDVDPTRPGFLESGDGGGSEARLSLVNAKVGCRFSSIGILDSHRPRSVARLCSNISNENIVRENFR